MGFAWVEFVCGCKQNVTAHWCLFELVDLASQWAQAMHPQHWVANDIYISGSVLFCKGKDINWEWHVQRDRLQYRNNMYPARSTTGETLTTRTPEWYQTSSNPDSRSTIKRNFNLKKTVYNIPVTEPASVPTSLPSTLDAGNLVNGVMASVLNGGPGYPQETFRQPAQLCTGYNENNGESIESILSQIVLEPALSSAKSFELNSRGVPLPPVPIQNNDRQGFFGTGESFMHLSGSSPSMYSDKSFLISTSSSSYTDSDMTRHSTNASLSSFSSVSTGMDSPLVSKTQALPPLPPSFWPGVASVESNFNHNSAAVDSETLFFSVSSINPYNDAGNLAKIADKSFPRYELHMTELTPTSPFLDAPSSPTDHFSLLQDCCYSPSELPPSFTSVSTPPMVRISKAHSLVFMPPLKALALFSVITWMPLFTFCPIQTITNTGVSARRVDFFYWLLTYLIYYYFFCYFFFVI